MDEELLIVPSGAPDSYCRLCLSEANVEPLLEVANECLQSKQSLVQLIKRYMEIDLSISLDSSYGICSSCRLLLEEFENFRERCLRCDFALNGKQRNGIQSESNQPFQCSERPNKFRIKSEYEKHWQSVHDLPHHCDRCDARFSMQSLLKFHQFRYHANAAVDSMKVSCTRCQRVFADEKQLQFHIQVLHGPAATENKFAHPTEKTNLVFHQQDAQSKKPFECEVCKIQFHFSGSLRRHISDAHGIKLGTPIVTGRQRGATAEQVEIPQPEIEVRTANLSTPIILPHPIIPNIPENPEIKPELPDPISATCMVVVPDYDQKPLIYDSSQISISNVNKNESIASSQVHQYPGLRPFVTVVKRLDPKLVPPIPNSEIPLWKIYYTEHQQLPELEATEQQDNDIATNYPSQKKRKYKKRQQLPELESTEQFDKDIATNYPSQKKRKYKKRQQLIEVESNEQLDNGSAKNYPSYKKKKKNKRFVCEICQKDFGYASSLSVHKQFVHEGIAYQCPECGRRFALRTSMERHVYQHASVLRYSCDECPMSFIEHCKWREHKNKYHVPGGPTLFIHFCPYCNRAFNKKSSLHGHVALMHRRQYTEGAHEEAASTEL